MVELKIEFPKKFYGIIGFQIAEFKFVKDTGKQFAIYYLTINKPVSVYYSIYREEYFYNSKVLYKTEKQALISLKMKCEKSIKYVNEKIMKNNEIETAEKLSVLNYSFLNKKK